MSDEVTELTRQYWIDTLLGWAESRLAAPQFDECRRAVAQTDCRAQVAALAATNDALTHALVRAEEENVPYRVTRLMDSVDYERGRVATYRARALALRKLATMARQCWRALKAERDAAINEQMELIVQLGHAIVGQEAAEARADALAALLIDGKDCFAWHTAGCAGDTPGHPCLCGYEKWVDDVHAALLAAPAEAARRATGAEQETK